MCLRSEDIRRPAEIENEPAHSGEVKANVGTISVDRSFLITMRAGEQLLTAFSAIPLRPTRLHKECWTVFRCRRFLGIRRW